MSAPAARTVPGRAVPGSAGLLEKLMAAVRPEFRADVLTFDPRDPVFGGPPCAVPGCERPARSRACAGATVSAGDQAGKPDLAQFTATAEPGWPGHLPLAACAVPGCDYGAMARAACASGTIRQWQSAGRPDLQRLADGPGRRCRPRRRRMPA